MNLFSGWVLGQLCKHSFQVELMRNEKCELTVDFLSIVAWCTNRNYFHSLSSIEMVVHRVCSMHTVCPLFNAKHSQISIKIDMLNVESQ